MSEELLRKIANAGGLFLEVTDPKEFLFPRPAGYDTYYHERPKTIDQALASVTEIRNVDKQKIGEDRLDYNLMLHSHMRGLMDSWRRVPSREEALADLLVRSHPDWDVARLFELGSQDSKANRATLMAALESATASRDTNRVRPQNAVTPLGVARKAAAAPAPVPSTPVPARPPVLISASTGSVGFRFPVASYTEQNGVLIFVQDLESPYLWSPSDTETVYGFLVEDKSLSASWSGVSYELDGMNHLVMILE